MQLCGHAIFGGRRAISHPPLIGPRILYLHVPRTGGSNLWHSAAHSFSAADRSIHILDIYHESLRRYGTIRETKRTIKDLALPRLNRGLIHHHTSFGVWRLLGSDFIYFTVLRDPVERAISYYFHSLNRHYEIDLERGTYRLKRRPKNEEGEPDLGDGSLQTLLQISGRHDLLSPESILPFIEAEKVVNYYVNLMHCYLEIEDEPPASFEPWRPASGEVQSLAEKMKRHFAGIFFSLEEAFAFLEARFKRKIRQRNKMPNRALRPFIKNPGELRRCLLPYFEHDYQLMALLGSPVDPL